MPAYVTHTIMARDVYKKLNDKNVSLDYMLTYSLGGDLTEFAKCRYESHGKKKDEFFKELCTYIKEHNLENDPEVLGTLYGHLCHYALDDIAHPLVRKVTKACKPGKNNHGQIESYYDIYMVDKKYNTTIKKYNHKELFRGKPNKKISKMLDYAYEKVFNCKHVSRYYKLNIFLYKKIRYAYLLFGDKLINKVRGLYKFLEINKDLDLFNNSHTIEYKNLKGELEKENFDTLYKESVKKALNDIKKIQKELSRK